MIGGVTRHKLPHLSGGPPPPCKQALGKKSGTVDSLLTDTSIQWTPLYYGQLYTMDTSVK